MSGVDFYRYSQQLCMFMIYKITNKGNHGESVKQPYQSPSYLLGQRMLLHVNMLNLTSENKTRICHLLSNKN